MLAAPGRLPGLALSFSVAMLRGMPAPSPSPAPTEEEAVWSR